MDIVGFAVRIRATGRIQFGDVRRLARDVLPNGITAESELELLLSLDRTIARRDPAWTEFLVAAVCDHAVRSADRDGFRSRLAAALGPRPTRTGRAILAAIDLAIGEAELIPAEARGMAEAPPQSSPDLEDAL
ncbi:MAG: hypothetical protein AB7O56_11820 [Bauldia sp.]